MTVVSLEKSDEPKIGSVRLSAATNTKPLSLEKLTTYIKVSKSTGKSLPSAPERV